MAQRCAIHERLCQLAKRYGDRALERLQVSFGLASVLQDASCGSSFFSVLELGGTIHRTIHRIDDC